MAQNPRARYTSRDAERSSQNITCIAGINIGLMSRHRRGLKDDGLQASFRCSGGLVGGHMRQRYSRGNAVLRAAGGQGDDSPKHRPT